MILSGLDTENISVEMIFFLHNSKWKDELAEGNIKSALPLTCQFCDFSYLSSKLTLFSLGISTLSIHRRRSAHSSDWCARTRKTGTSWEWPSKRLREIAQHKCLKGRWPCRGPQSYTQKQIYKLRWFYQYQTETFDSGVNKGQNNERNKLGSDKNQWEMYHHTWREKHIISNIST